MAGSKRARQPKAELGDDTLPETLVVHEVDEEAETGSEESSYSGLESESDGDGDGDFSEDEGDGEVDGDGGLLRRRSVGETEEDIDSEEEEDEEIDHAGVGAAEAGAETESDDEEVLWHYGVVDTRRLHSRLTWDFRRSNIRCTILWVTSPWSGTMTSRTSAITLTATRSCGLPREMSWTSFSKEWTTRTFGMYTYVCIYIQFSYLCRCLCCYIKVLLGTHTRL